jgi:acyl-CoA reductase-like NAD-dependent aldehyde dehydrogenase
MSEARALARRASAAQRLLGELSQVQIDTVVTAMATAVTPHAEALARLAVEETRSRKTSSARRMSTNSSCR